jgi:hypothetical protein
MAVRIQLKRKKGWKLPTGAINCARPTKWGNPFRIGDEYEWMNWVTGEWETGIIRDNATAVDLYRQSIGKGCTFEADIKRELRGHDLACYCRPIERCHCDVLLEIANA